MSGRYFLASHPYPKLEGELLVFKPNKLDQNKERKDEIIYRDYSLRKRIETTPKTNWVQDSLRDRKKSNARGSPVEREPTPEIKANLQSLEVDITDPLTKEEWDNFLETIVDT